jgi:hypothetical protein
MSWSSPHYRDRVKFKVNCVSFVKNSRMREASIVNITVNFLGGFCTVKIEVAAITPIMNRL